MNTVYRAIAGRIRTELPELAQVVERTGRIWQQAALSADDYYVDATALNLDFKTADRRCPTADR